MQKIITKVLVDAGRGGHRSAQGQGLYIQMRRNIPEGELIIHIHRKGTEGPFFDVSAYFTPANGFMAGDRAIKVPVEIVADTKNSFEAADPVIVWEEEVSDGG